MQEHLKNKTPDLKNRCEGVHNCYPVTSLSYSTRGAYIESSLTKGVLNRVFRIVSSRGNLFPSNGWLRDLKATAALPSSCLYFIKLNYNKQAFISFWDKKNIFTLIKCIAIKFILLKPAKGKNVNWIWERTITRKKEEGEKVHNCY